jgi:anti-sigma regulatory factor (Ser/Thr protein kinase)
LTAQSSQAGAAYPAGRRVPPAERDFGPLDAFLRSAPVEQAAEGGFAALRFDASPDSVTGTRRFLRSTLTGWQLADLVDDAAVVTAELVANAVTHALRGPLTPARGSFGEAAWLALLRMDHAVVCAVADPSPALPAMHEPEPFAESGRGLRIVAELSETWGHEASPGPGAAGKTVWARLASGR